MARPRKRESDEHEALDFVADCSRVVCRAALSLTVPNTSRIVAVRRANTGAELSTHVNTQLQVTGVRDKGVKGPL